MLLVEAVRITPTVYKQGHVFTKLDSDGLPVQRKFGHLLRSKAVQLVVALR